jgi:hypothetical protein
MKLYLFMNHFVPLRQIRYAKSLSYPGPSEIIILKWTIYRTLCSKLGYISHHKYLMKKLVALVLFCVLSTSAFSQISRTIRRMYFDKDTTRKSSFVILPVLSSAPETGLEVGGAGLSVLLYRYLQTKHTRVKCFWLCLHNYQRSEPCKPYQQLLDSRQ